VLYSVRIMGSRDALIYLPTLCAIFLHVYQVQWSASLFYKPCSVVLWIVKVLMPIPYITPDPTVHCDGDPDNFFMSKLINSCPFSYKHAKFTLEMQIKNNFWKSKVKRTIFVNIWKTWRFFFLKQSVVRDRTKCIYPYETGFRSTTEWGFIIFFPYGS
jgi:hypothetical protein